MLNLCLHCGAQSADRSAVEASPTPDRTRTWVPIPHRRLLQQVEATLTGCGLRIVNEAHGLWGDGQRYFGLLEIRSGRTEADYGLVIGLRNSHDKSFPAALAIGAGVFVCDNLSFSGEVSIARRHTRFIDRDLPRVVSTAIGRLADLRVKQDTRIAAYKETDLSDAAVHDLIIRSIDVGALPVTQVPEVVAEWRSPRYGEFERAGKTAWRLFNAFTEAIKSRNLLALPRRSQALHGLIDSGCGLAA